MHRRTLVLGAAGLAACATQPASELKVGAARSVSVGVADLDAASALFQTTMGYALEARGSISAQRAAFWGLGRGLRGRWAELSCAGYPVGRVRLLHLTPTPQTFVRHDFGDDAFDSPIAIGPKALDVYAQSSLEAGIAAFRSQGLSPRTETPARYPGGLEEIVFTGPGRMPLMQMSRPAAPNGDMRPNMPTDRFSEVATMSIICADLAASRRFYGELLGFKARFDRVAPEGFRAPVAKLIGAPPELQAHWMIFNAETENSAKILLIHFADAAKSPLKNTMSPAHLGIGLYTFPCSDIDALAAKAAALNFEVAAKPARIDGTRCVLIRGPNAELCEFVQISA